MLSRAIDLLSVMLLLVGVGVNLLQIAERNSGIPPIADSVGRFASPTNLPIWINIALALGAALATTERALRLRYTCSTKPGTDRPPTRGEPAVGRRFPLEWSTTAYSQATGAGSLAASSRSPSCWRGWSSEQQQHPGASDASGVAG